MKRPDLILLHAPSVYDFRKYPIMYGPISDVVPSTGVFEMYPIGLTTIAEYLNRYKYRARIINVAVKMLHDPNYDAEKQMKKLRAKAFGIDLHWLPHAHGSIELARIIKKYHPDTPVIFGGLSASYFHEELLKNYPEVDYVVKGDSTEEPVKMLMDYIVKGVGNPSEIPNLSFRKNGGVISNPVTNIPDNLDHLSLDYRFNVFSVLKYRKIDELLPCANWLEHPISAILSCRGCVQNCITCGGSNAAYDTVCSRRKVAMRSPELLIRDMLSIQRFFKGPLFILGDLWQGGEGYIERFIEAARGKKFKSPVIIELFWPASREYLEALSEIFPHLSLEISVESHDEEIRRAFGKHFTNENFEQFLKDALDVGCRKIDLFFITGLPRQTKESVLATVDYCKYLYEKIDGDGRLYPFISPLAPFVDPGSKVFEDPEKFGYRLLYDSLEEYRQALTSPSWKNMLNYETVWMTRDELALSTYQAGIGLTKLKAEYGALDAKTAEALEERGMLAISVLKKLDEIQAIEDEVERQKALTVVWPDINRVNSSTICEQAELEWKTLSVFTLAKPFLLLRYGKKFYRNGVLQGS